MLGIATGLIVTFFGGIIMVALRAYVPPRYPVVLIGFNLLLWMTIGFFSGFFVEKACKKNYFGGKDDVIWVVFFLLPFIVIYGILGRIPIPHAVTFYFLFDPASVYDYHLSFVWAALMLLCSKHVTKKQPFHHLVLCLDLFFITILFQFCSNLGCFLNYYPTAVNILRSLLGMESSGSTLLIYSAGVCLIFMLYITALLKIRPSFYRFVVKYNHLTVALLLVFVCGSVYIFYAASPQTPIPSMHPVEGGSTNKKPPVILLTLDSLRADRLSVYNPSLSTSGHLAKFARDCLVFERCIAPSSWTMPSYASLFTGLYLSEHKCDLWFTETPAIPEGCSTLAEIFKDNGYTTAAVFSNPLLNSRGMGFSRGFQIFDCIESIGKQQKLAFKPLLCVASFFSNVYTKTTLAYKRADDINTMSMRIIDSMGNAPFFLCSNYMDTHVPYLPPRPFDSRFSYEQYPRLQGLTSFFTTIRNIRDESTAQAFFQSDEKTSWDAFVQSQYDGAIAYLDDNLGMLFAYLKQKGLYDRAFIIVTADHGEMLGEHNQYEHRRELYEEVVHIPLMIKFPFNSRVGRENRLINLTDMFSTILHICNLPIPRGVSAVPFGGKRSVVSGFFSDPVGEQRILYDELYKYTEYNADNEAYPQKTALYDLAANPEETENIAEKEPERLASMKQKMARWKQQIKNYYKKKTKDSAVSDQIKQTMKALGYIQ